MINSAPSYTDRLTKIRSLLSANDLNGFIVPMSDEYQNEYVADHDKRIEFVSGFSGSAAFVIILMDRAIFFTDSRYTLQAKKQIDSDLYTIKDVMEITPSEWLSQHLPTNLKIGFDPQLHTTKQIKNYEAHAFKQKGSIIPVDKNPIDALWEDQPEKPTALIVPHDECYAGESTTDKRRKICEKLREHKIKATVITDPASVAWLLNIRGNDVPKTPLPLSVLILHQNETVQWFVDPHKISKELDTFNDPSIQRYTPNDFESELQKLGVTKETVQVDPDLTSFFVSNTLQKAGATLKLKQDPCILPRACKNKTEIKGMIAAHERDGIALVRFLFWLDHKMAAKNSITEIDIDQKLTSYRAEGKHYKGLSFSTIAGSGPNGAIVHYCASPDTNRTLKAGDFLLVDSGAQYLDGTTDVTRTIPLGNVDEEMKDRFTRVLMGHIDLAKARFPSGLTGSSLDSLARQYLWDVGLDYGHGTGHGVGSYLGVHEGPQNISRRSDVALRPRMVLSNEPGYYKEGAFGIRHENLQCVIELKSISSENNTMLGFRPLTLAPFDQRAIKTEMLTNHQKEWLNEYHGYVYDTLAPHLDDETKAWLKEKTVEV